MMGKLIDVVGGSWSVPPPTKPAEAELARAKAQLKAGLLMGLESSSARAEQMARQLLLFDRLIDTAELVERIEAVTADDVRALAGQAAWANAAVGRGRGRRTQGGGLRADGRARGACVSGAGVAVQRLAHEGVQWRS